MKKLTFVAALAVGAMTFVSCGNSTPKANLKNDIDTVSYALGVVNTQGFRDYVMRGDVIDTAYIDEFFRGLNAGVNVGDDKKKQAYYFGMQIGQQISNQMMKGINHDLFGEDSTKTISLKNFMAAFIAGAKGEKSLMTVEQAQAVLGTKVPAIRARELERQYGENKKAGEKYLADYAKKAGVKKLKGGVLYRVIKAGTGETPKDTSLVRVHYEGKTIGGKVFESSYENKQPVTFRVNQMVPGFATALANMPAGSVWEVVIPQEQAYGERQTPKIKPFSTLIFKIELVGLGAGK